MKRTITRKFTIQMLAAVMFMAQALYLHAEVRPADKASVPIEETVAFDDFDFSVYPNPYKEGPINLEIDGNVSAALQIKLYNTIGKIVLTKDFQYGSDYSQLSLNPTEKLAPGLYFLSVSMQGENFSKTKKLIVSE
jgi:hypothetical protein